MAVTRNAIVRTNVSTHVQRGPVATALMPVARRVMPLVTASAGVAIATLAAERALAGFALRAAERTGLMRTTAQPDAAVTRVTVIHTTVVERISRRG